MRQIIYLDSDMFQDDTDINCYNLVVSTKDGVQYWDVDRFIARYPRMGRALVSNFENGVMCFDLKRCINLSLV